MEFVECQEWRGPVEHDGSDEAIVLGLGPAAGSLVGGGQIQPRACEVLGVNRRNALVSELERGREATWDCAGNHFVCFDCFGFG